ncbi:hypothetical protein HPB50_027962 [Hyalomma asiaticum]|nr:hypothetical protein HPB50_027962 [Hyalomma asiaticum]
MSMQTTDYDHQHASWYLSAISRLRSQVSYHCSKSKKLLEKLATEEQRSALYRENKHHDSPSGEDLFQWTKEVVAAVESCGFNIIRIVTDYSANTTMLKHMGNGSLRTVTTHPHDP